jgi:hypothetical protein
MSQVLNHLYASGPQALFKMPLDVLDKANIVKFRDLDGHVIKNDGGTDVVGPTANFGALPRQEHSIGSHVQVAYGIKKTMGVTQRSTHLPDSVVAADINLRNEANEGTFQVRGFDAAGNKAVVANINQLALVSFDAHSLHVGNWLSVQTQQSLLAYYLPWKKNYSRVLKLSRDADFFFTSSLTGCTVQVFGSPQAPSVTHTNGGGFENTKDAQLYMTNLLQQYKDVGPGYWDPLKNYSEDLTATHYRKMEKNYWERKTSDQSVEINSQQVKPESRTVVVGFRNRADGLWSFYYQQWVKVAYTKIRQLGPQQFERVEKKKIGIKRVAQFWPVFNVLADSWKEQDFADRND